MNRLYSAIIITFCLVSGYTIPVFASDAETYESSTASTYYDKTLDQKQEQIEKMGEFKEKISSSVEGLKGSMNAPQQAVKTAQDKYSSTQAQSGAVLGSLYGTRGKLELDKNVKGEQAVIGGITGVSDTQVFNPQLVTDIDTAKNMPVVPEVTSVAASAAPETPATPTVPAETTSTATTAVTDTGNTNTVTTEPVIPAIPETPPTPMCHTVCRQVGYGQDCTQVCY